MFLNIKNDLQCHRSAHAFAFALKNNNYSVKLNDISSAQLENLAFDIMLGRYYDHDSKTIQKDSVDEISTLYGFTKLISMLVKLITRQEYFTEGPLFRTNNCFEPLKRKPVLVNRRTYTCS